ncbi:MAG: hypothetical protein NTZ20_03240, partial [Candidatus Levybacteria bacterium]|nr:hypothetical protein [Candidatus Levybacteria bacterium]
KEQQRYISSLTKKLELFAKEIVSDYAKIKHLAVDSITIGNKSLDQYVGNMIENVLRDDKTDDKIKKIDQTIKAQQKKIGELKIKIEKIKKIKALKQ